jgi:hypothetical protein
MWFMLESITAFVQAQEVFDQSVVLLLGVVD